MANKVIQALAAGDKGNGVFFLDKPESVVDVEGIAKAAGLAFFHLEGAKIESKKQFMNHAAVAMHFPDYFGKNWDAFEEMVTDFTWVEDGNAQGFLIYFDHIDPFHTHHQAEFETLVEIFQDAADDWEEGETRFLVILSGSHVPKGATRA